MASITEYKIAIYNRIYINEYIYKIINSITKTDIRPENRPYIGSFTLRESYPQFTVIFLEVR